MRKLVAFPLALAACALLAVSTLVAADYKVETIEAPGSGDVPKAVLDALEAQGARVVGDDGAVCEVWLRKTLATQEGSGEALGVLYTTLQPGSYLGVLHFPEQGADFRGQPIKPGFYGLRYVLIPQDGAHMGVYQWRDTLAMTPVSEDTQLDKALRLDEMVTLSRKVSGTPHPAVLVMGEVQEGEGFPSVVEGYSGYTNLQVTVHGESGDLPIAITVVGEWEGM